MKKIKYIIAVLAIFICIACSIKKDDLEGAVIYTTSYPINYITTYLYADYGEIASIYPIDSDPNTYKLNDTQYRNYAKGDLFIYNGLTSEKEIAKELMNKNGNLLIIDVTYGLNDDISYDDLWINPSNYLIVAKNIKTNLSENVKSIFIVDEINKKYADFEEKLSLIDARLHSLAKTANNNSKTIVIANEKFSFLENYGFVIVNLADDSINKNNKLDNIKSYFKTGKYKYILAEESQKNDELLTSLKGTILSVNNFNGIDEKDYFNYMTSFVDQIETIVS